MNENNPETTESVENTDSLETDLTELLREDEPTTAAQAAPSTGRHPVSIGHLVMGVAFASILAIWALYVTDNAGLDDLRWLTPLPWLLAGFAGLLAVILAPRRRAQRQAGTDPLSRG